MPKPNGRRRRKKRQRSRAQKKRAKPKRTWEFKQRCNAITRSGKRCTREATYTLPKWLYRSYDDRAKLMATGKLRMSQGMSCCAFCTQHWTVFGASYLAKASKSLYTSQMSYDEYCALFPKECMAADAGKPIVSDSWWPF